MKIRSTLLMASSLSFLSALGAKAQKPSSTLVAAALDTTLQHFRPRATHSSTGGEVQIAAGTYTGQTTISNPTSGLSAKAAEPSSTVLTDNLSAAGTGSDQASSTFIVTNAATGFYAREPHHPEHLWHRQFRQ